MSEIPPQIITLGQPEFYIFDAAILETYGMPLQNIAIQDKELAITALAIGLTAVAHNRVNDDEDNLALIYNDDKLLKDGCSPITLRKLNGRMAYKESFNLEVDNAIDRNMPDQNSQRQKVVVQVLCPQVPFVDGFKDEETQIVATINLSD